MERRARRTLLAASLLAALAGAPLRAAAEPRVVEIVARRFQFTPNVVTLKKGEPVILRLRSEDVIHGFFQRPLGIDTTIPPGKVTDVPLTPREAGSYAVICHHFCGAGHGNMKLTLVVE
jgi:cytochrome c oxidase subunit 2